MLRTLRQWLDADTATRVRELADVVARAGATDTELGAYIALSTLDDIARASAGSVGPWAGVPIAVKDNLDVLGFATTAGTPALAGTAPAADAGAVHALRALGAAVIGKSNLHELALGITNNNHAYGPVRNPHDAERMAGGSSGGSAALVARGDVPVSIGTDTGGSISIPAAFCAVAGFRPTPGRYPSNGIVHLSWTRDTVGLHAGGIDDLRTADAAITGRRERPVTVRARDVVVGVSDEFFADVDPVVETRMTGVREALLDAGVRIVAVDLGDALASCAAPEHDLVRWEAPRALAAHLSQNPVHGVALSVDELAQAVASPDVAGILADFLDDPCPPETYRRSLGMRAALRTRYVSALDAAGADLLIMPTTPTRVPKLTDVLTLRHNGRTEPIFTTVTRHTAYGSFIGAPMVTIPTLIHSEPVGVTVQGRFGDDDAVLAAARSLEPVLTRPPHASARPSPRQ